MVFFIFIPAHLFHKFIIYFIVLVLFDAILVFLIRYSPGLHWNGRHFLHEGLQNLPMPPTTESYVKVGGIKGL